MGEDNLMETEKWYSRPVFSVSNIRKSLQFYCDLLGFDRSWKYEENGHTIVTQVSKGDLELILAANLDRVGNGRIFISLDGSELAKLEQLIKAKEIETENIHWGYPTIRIKDLDGNEMLFPLED